MSEVRRQVIVPQLRPYNWEGSASSLTIPIFNGVMHSPVIGFALEQDDSYGFLPSTDNFKRQLNVIVGEAIRHLGGTLADASWQRLDERGIYTIEVEEFAPEALLCSACLLALHNFAGAETMLVCSPAQREIYACSADSDIEIIQGFRSFCIQRYQQAEAENIHISEHIWQVEQGGITGCWQGDAVDTDEARLVQGCGHAISSTAIEPKPTLFSSLQIGAASFLATPLAGAYMLLRNEQQINRARAQPSSHLFTWLVLCSALTPLVYVWVPETKYDRFFPLFSALLMITFVNLFQGKYVANIPSTEFNKRSFWKSALIILISLLFWLLIFSLGLGLGWIENR